MSAELLTPAALRLLLDDAEAPDEGGGDYILATRVGVAFFGRARTGEASLLVPLTTAPSVAGRRGGGFALRPLATVAFEFEGAGWEQPAAVVECTDPTMIDAFLVLVVDVARRLAMANEVTWSTVLAFVDEWQALLARRAVMTVERQLGLWAELWLLSISSEPDRLAAAWRGPDGDATDFFVDGSALEVKASRKRHEHHVSLRQVADPVGRHAAYVMSVWIGVDPDRGQSLPELVEGVLARAADGPTLLKRIAQIGYSPADRDHYSTRFIVLDLPLWWHVDDVPRVRQVDPGISQVRYVVALDPERAVADAIATALWQQFCRIVPSVP